MCQDIWQAHENTFQLSNKSTFENSVDGSVDEESGSFCSKV